MKLSWHFIICLTILIIFPGFAFSAEKIAVLDLTNKSGLPENDIYFLTEQVRGQVARSLPSSYYSIMTRENIFDLVPPGTDLAKCTEAECEVKIGRMIGADYIVTGDVLTFAGEYRLILKVHQTKSSAFLGEKTVSGADPKALEAQAKLGADEIAALIRKRTGTGIQEGSTTTTPETWDLPITEKEVVRFESTPSGAVVRADGQLICQSTPCSREIALGSVSIEMEKVKYFPGEKVINVKKKMPAVSWILKPNFGWLNVSSVPLGMSIRINGEVVGKTPIQNKILDPGAYEVMITDSTYHEQNERFNLSAGDRKDINFTLTPKMGAIDVSASDTQGNAVRGDVYVDGKKVGQAPGTMKVIIGQHAVEVKTKGGSWKDHVEVREKQITNVRAEIKKAIVKKKRSRPNQGTVTGATLTGFGGMVTIIGGAMYALAVRENDEFKNADNVEAANDARDTGQTYEIVGYTGIGVGLVITGVGIYYLVTSVNKKSANSRQRYYAGYSPVGGKHQFVFGFRY